ncbi:uncharacterized protein LOC133186109 [Saccostrea echinata]|uniref:uncharacterized protein LOC133186109 n=1 Tax=Saccostrea echinata TaxID=191078 RepID=UPI002A83983B|nr:uncharacterized protein LOC133186109 [Saccostrea echinata]
MAVWVTTTGCHIPDGAIRAGYEADGRPLFTARAQIEGITTPGKCGYHLPGAHIPYGCKERVIGQYEVLVHPTNAPGFFEWQRASGGIVPDTAFKTDKETYVGRAYFSGSLIPCKIATGYQHKCAYMGYGGKEHNTKDYEVLCKIK